MKRENKFIFKLSHNKHTANYAQTIKTNKMQLKLKYTFDLWSLLISKLINGNN